MAWRSSSVAFLLVPLPPSTFLVYGLPLRPGFSFSFFFSSFRGFVHFASTGLLTSVWGVVGGAGREGARG